MSPNKKILVADDEADIRRLVRQTLIGHYDVVEACDGEAAIDLALQARPDLILLDVMMPRVNGYEALRRLRASYATRSIPIIMLTAKNEKQDVLTGFEGGANDYLTKPYERGELLLRIENQLGWSRQQREASPLTGLPGNLSINRETERRLGSGQPFALLQVDIDHFKAYNDHYGYPRGDEAIGALSRILVEAASRDAGAFVGHIGGDDFVLLTAPEHAEAIGQRIIDQFNAVVPSFYDPEDRARGHIQVPNRRHVLEDFPLMSVTIALVSTDRAQVTHLAQLTDIAQELKAHGKGIPGSVLVGERRSHTETTAPEAERDAA